VSRQLAKQGMLVCLGVRDLRKGEAAARVIGDGARPLALDVDSQSSLTEGLREIERGYGRLDVLINNAGIDTGRQRSTVDGFELTFAVNYLAPFLFTCSLLDVLRSSAPSRVLNIVSGGHRGGRIDFDDLQSQRRFTGQRAYNTSKLALVLFTYQLARRLSGEHVTVNCVDPGFVRGTNIGQDTAAGYRLIGALMWPFMATPQKAAGGIVWAASDPSLAEVTGAYLKRGTQGRSSSESRDTQLAQRLWNTTEQLLARFADSGSNPA
jgi:NAD(P)-dependent dehydrogenase (short-subunit alcohol dehydrogenase family)